MLSGTLPTSRPSSRAASPVHDTAARALPQPAGRPGLSSLPPELVERIAVELTPGDFAQLKATSRRNEAILAAPIVKARMEENTLARIDGHLRALQNAESPAQRLQSLGAAADHLRQLWPWVRTLPAVPAAVERLCAALEDASSPTSQDSWDELPEAVRHAARTAFSLLGLKPGRADIDALLAGPLRESVMALGRYAFESAEPGTRADLMRFIASAPCSPSGRRDRAVMLSQMATSMPPGERVAVVFELRYRTGSDSYDTSIDHMLATRMTRQQSEGCGLTYRPTNINQSFYAAGRTTQPGRPVPIYGRLEPESRRK